MGNKGSHEHHHRGESHGHSPTSPTLPTPEIFSSFKELTDGEAVLTFDKFKEKFGEFLSAYLWKYLQTDPSVSQMTLEQFSEHARSLAGMSTDIYVKILGSAGALLKASFEAAGITVTERDKHFIRSLKADMTQHGDSFEALIKWKNTVCPRICHPIQDKVLDTFYHRKRNVDMMKSEILTSVEMFILIHSLPITIFFPRGLSEENVCKSIFWTRLYSSHHQGISINRFDANVFQYKGATISIFQMTNHEVFVVAIDEELRHSVNKFGGPNTALWKFRPDFKSFDLPEKPVYCNFKLRSGVYGLNVGRHFSVDGEMATVADIEVWGCAGNETLQEQQKMKLRAKMQAERSGQVPLPGNWDENPDKNIMEMAGFEFSSERKDNRPPNER